MCLLNGLLLSHFAVLKIGISVVRAALFITVEFHKYEG